MRGRFRLGLLGLARPATTANAGSPCHECTCSLMQEHGVETRTLSWCGAGACEDAPAPTAFFESLHAARFFLHSLPTPSEKRCASWSVSQRVGARGSAPPAGGDSDSERHVFPSITSPTKAIALPARQHGASGVSFGVSFCGAGVPLLPSHRQWPRSRFRNYCAHRQGLRLA